jgi:probable F420-dependent oxidoreductase
VSVRLGLLTPVVRPDVRIDGTAGLVRATSRWELNADIEDVVEVVRTAEAFGYDFVSCAEHFALPIEVADAVGGRYWDPISTLAFLAARTTRIRLATHVIVLGYHHPLEILKRFGTLDHISGGRLILGVGVGQVEPEFAALGAAFRGRGERADESLRAIRCAMSLRNPSYTGRYYQYGDVVVEPSLRREVPIWVGGRTLRSLRRAIELGDGWMPYGLDAAALRRLLTRDDVTSLLSDRETPFDLVLPTEPAVDPLDDPDRARSIVDELTSLGANVLDVRLDHQSKEHLADQMGAMAELVKSASPPAH